MRARLVEVMLRAPGCNSADETVGNWITAFAAATLVQRTEALVPVRNLAQAVRETDTGLEAEGLLGAARLQLAPRLTIRLGGVPDDVADETDDPRDGLGKDLDADLLAAADVDRLGAVVPLQCEPEGARRIVDMQELASG